MKRILLIEDDQLIAELEARILTQDGLTVVKAETLDEARQAMKDAAFDLIMADLQLAAGGAEDTIEFLAPHAKSLPIVICSGHYATSRGLTLRTTCAACGFSAYLDKYDLAMTGPKLGANLLEAYNRFHSNGEPLA